MRKKTKLIDDKFINKSRREFIDNAAKNFEGVADKDWPNQMPFQSGLYNSDVPEPLLEFKMAPGASLLDSQGIRNGKHNAFIILGSDRPDSLKSGYGGKGANRANTIDLVVGRMSCARNGKGPKDGTHVDNMFGCDAARVYISQLTDIDRNFGLASGKIGSAMARSGIGIKADGVRIIGREGVKIVTGKCDGCKYGFMKGEQNSLGGKIVRPSPGIELLAGNNTGTRKVWGGFRKPGFEYIPYMQPVTLGFQTRDAFRELSFLVDKLWAAVFNFMFIQGIYNSIIGITSWPFDSASHGVAASFAAAMFIPWVSEPLYSMRTQKLEWEVNYLQPFGYKYICSRNVRTT